MATGTQTADAGEHALDFLDQYLVYIPAQAVGTRRLPLIVSLGGGGVGARETMDLERPLADKYGWILFAPNISGPEISEQQMADLDAGLKQVLRKYAIDPDQIVLTGMSNGGYVALDVGCKNLDIFSRIAPLSAVPTAHVPCGDTVRPKQQRTQFYLSFGVGEPHSIVSGSLAMLPVLRHEGHPAQVALEIRFHARRLQDRDLMWHWLQQSWAAPGTPMRPPVVLDAASMPPFTSEAIAKMTAFWTSFRQLPDSIRQAPPVYRKDIMMPVGPVMVSRYAMVDMPAIAKNYPMVAADLTKAGLTVQQEERYRIALLSARTSKVAQNQVMTTVPILAKNLEFFTAHESDMNALLDLMKVPRCETTVQASYGC
jgi:hypothetical protein